MRGMPRITSADRGHEVGCFDISVARPLNFPRAVPTGQTGVDNEVQLRCCVPSGVFAQYEIPGQGYKDVGYRERIFKDFNNIHGKTLIKNLRTRKYIIYRTEQFD